MEVAVFFFSKRAYYDRFLLKKYTKSLNKAFSECGEALKIFFRLKYILKKSLAVDKLRGVGYNIRRGEI